MLNFEVIELDKKYNLGIYEEYTNSMIGGTDDLIGSVYKEIKHPLYNVDQWSLEPIMYSYLTAAATRAKTKSAFEPIIYIPLFLGLIGLTRPFDDPSGFFQESVEIITNLALANPSRTFLLPLSRICRFFYVWPWKLDLPDNVIVLSVERFFPHKNAICVPWPSNYFYHDVAEIQHRLAVKKTGAKPYTACFFGRKRGDGHPRSQIIAAIEESATIELVSSFVSAHRIHRLSDDAAVQLSELRQRSWISIEPPGDSPSRKGIFDALLGLSLPLLMESGRYDYPFSRVFPWDKTCYFVTASDEWRLLNRRQTFDRMLSDIAVEDMLERIELVARHVMLLQYTAPNVRNPSMKDAFFAIESELESLMMKRVIYDTAA